MKTNLSPLQQAGAFSGIVLALALGVAIALPSSAPESAGLFYMYTPMTATLIMMFVVTREGRKRAAWRDLGLFNLGVRYWPVAIVAPALVAIAGLLASYLLPSVTPTAPNIVQTIIQSVILLAIATVGWTLGEEFGWRGYLLPRLRVLGDTKAIVISGIVWGLWHMPIIFFTSMYHSDGNRLIVVPLFFIAIVGGSFFFGYLRIFSGSVWPASLAHTAHNLAWEVTGGFMIVTSPVAEEYVGGDNGIVIVIGTVLATGYLLWREKRRSRQSVTPAVGGSRLAHGEVSIAR